MAHETYLGGRVEAGDGETDTDRVARSLVDLCLNDAGGDAVGVRADGFISSLIRAHRGRGRFACRQDCRHSLDALSDETSGRAIGAIGTAAACLSGEAQRLRARHLFESASQFRSPHVRSTAFAVVGAARVIENAPTSMGALKLLIAAAHNLDRDDLGPEPHEIGLRDEAIVGQALILLGTTLGLESYRAEGLRQLRELVAQDGTNQVGAITAPAYTPSTF